MSNEKSSFTRELEELLNKTIEANKAFIVESSRLAKKMTTRSEGQPVSLLQPELITKAFNAFATLNIQHMKNILDLSVSLVRQAGETVTEDQQDNDTNRRAPSFILRGSATVGGKVSLQFILDNVKKEDALCKLVNSTYSSEDRQDVRANFPTTFNPQSFPLKRGESQTVAMHIEVPKDVIVGVYSSDVQVLGFEPAYFQVIITVTNPSPKTPKSHGSRKRR